MVKVQTELLSITVRHCYFNICQRIQNKQQETKTKSIERTDNEDPEIEIIYLFNFSRI